MRPLAAARTGRARQPPRACFCAALLAGALALGALAAPAADAAGGCITRLPVTVSLPDGPYAAGYAREIRVRVNPRGPRIRNLRAELFTFTGRRMAVSVMRRAVLGVATLELRLGRIFRPLQTGGYTLVLTGEPNAGRSCGPKQAIRVLRFRACRARLPVTFPKLPSGRAADYGGYLSVPVRSTDGTVIRDVRSSVSAFDGSLLGSAPSLLALFGEQTLDQQLVRPLQPGSYTVVVEGRIADQPASCGRKTASATMTFS